MKRFKSIPVERKGDAYDGKFVHGMDIERERLDWGGLGWISRPSSTGAARLTVIEVTLERRLRS